jgi:hypothetical protein
MEILILLFINWCFTTGVINASILDQIRNYFLVRLPMFGKLISCVRCLGFWVGFFTFGAYTYLEKIDGILFFPIWLNYLIYPFVQSASCVILENFIIFLGKLNYININKDTFNG